jgi:GNAT superfamily N-acetyltransferase
MLSHYEAEIIEKGIELSWKAWSKMCGHTLISGDISYLKSEGERGFERIFSVKLGDKNADSRIQQMIAYIRAGIYPDSILITSETKPGNLAELLLQRVFTIDTSGSCMMMQMADYVGQNACPDHIKVINVASKEQLGTWLEIVSTALFGYELITLEQFADLLNLDNTHFCLGTLNDKAVTACMTIIHGDTSLLEMVATLDEYRRKGLATATIDKALRDLRQKGVKTVSLRAEPDAIQLYKHLGFKECFARIVANL